MTSRIGRLASNEFLNPLTSFASIQDLRICPVAMPSTQEMNASHLACMLYAAGIIMGASLRPF